MSLQNEKKNIYKYKAEKNIKLTLYKNSNVEYIPNFLTEEESKCCLDELLNNTSWMHGEYMMFGKSIKTPRLLWAMRDKDFKIPESYSVTGSSVYSSVIDQLRRKVEKQTGRKLLYAQCNYYRDGKDYIGWHTDSEVVNGDIIASISLGATRKFSMRVKDYKTNKEVPKHEFQLNNGSLLILDYNASTKYWKHCLPKMTKLKELRINITFRNK